MAWFTSDQFSIDTIKYLKVDALLYSDQFIISRYLFTDFS
jgi:hypothetical protein